MGTFSRNGSLIYPPERGHDLQPVLRGVYLWMGLGTLLTAIVAYVTTNTSLVGLDANPVVLVASVAAEFAAILVLNASFNRLSSAAVTALFFAYAALNGFVFSLVLLLFHIEAVVSAFAATAVLFGVMSAIGYTARVDLTRTGAYLMMGVIGLGIAVAMNVFINDGAVNLLISMVGVLLFTGLTAYDTQRIGHMAAQMDAKGNGTAVSRFGALKLYLDFINMYLFMLRSMTDRRRS